MKESVFQSELFDFLGYMYLNESIMPIKYLLAVSDIFK